MRLPKKLLQLGLHFQKFNHRRKIIVLVCSATWATSGVSGFILWDILKGGFAKGAGSEESSNGCDQDAREAIPTRVFIPSVGSKGGTKISGWKFQEGRFQINRMEKLSKGGIFLLWNGLARGRMFLSETGCLDGVGSWTE